MKGKTQRKGSARKIWIPIVVIVLAAAGAAGYFYWSQMKVSTAEAASTSTYTSQVRRGSITISVSGSGTLQAAQEKNLAFTADGTVASLDVAVGDTVKKGQVLAALDNQSELEANLASAKQDLASAQKDLATLKAAGPENIANAQLTLASAQKAVLDAKSGVITPGMQRCDTTTTDAYYYRYMKAVDALNALGDGGGNQDYYLNKIVPAKNAVAQAYAVYENCAGFTSYEIQSSQATLSLDEAKLVQAEADLKTLQENGGVDPVELATAENKAASAQLAVDKAQKILDGATLKAPFDGTILTVSGVEGDDVTAGTTFITIADMSNPKVKFTVDETDMDKVAVGETATIDFDAIPNVTFSGKVTRIDPALTQSSGYYVLTGMIEMDRSKDTSGATLRKGLNASVQLVQASAKNVLLVSVQALRSISDGSYAVFVVQPDGSLQMTPVEVGLMDAANAEIKSGLAEGDVVSTGTVETK